MNRTESSNNSSNAHINILDNLCHNSFCANPYSSQLYFIFMKELIPKILEHSENYKIYVSTTDKYNQEYQQIKNTLINDQERIIFTTDGFIPSNLQLNGNVFYIYHNTNKPSQEEQQNLLNFMRDHPNIKYVYAGKLSNLNQTVVLRNFDYGLHFQKLKGRWSRINCRYIAGWKLSRKIGRYYHGLSIRKKNNVNPFMAYDYYVFKNFVTGEELGIKFNGIMIRPRRKKITKPKINLNEQSKSTNSEISVKTKYIYSDSHPRGNALYLPDGTTLNFKKIVEEYTIEI